jgi:hypothetical protein
VDPRADLDDVEKRKFLRPPVLELGSLCCPVRSQSLYALPYPGSPVYENPHAIAVNIIKNGGPFARRLKNTYIFTFTSAIYFEISLLLFCLCLDIKFLQQLYCYCVVARILTSFDNNAVIMSLRGY